MNKNRRERLRQANQHLEQAVSIVESVKDEEQGCMDNMPENLQGSERYESMENAVDAMEDAISSIHEAEESIEGAVDS